MGNSPYDLAVERAPDAAILTIVADRFNILKRLGNHVQPVGVANHKDFSW
jgi:hypothetical protein